jgi:peptidoglycan/xylan/chitin deacetylase (PgdA/CDA1 family)
MMNPLRQLMKFTLTACLPRQMLLANGPHSPFIKPEIALTFDDGPHPRFTPRLLDQLGEFGVRATFFVLGRKVEAFPELIQRIVAEGHQIGNHTFHHTDPKVTPVSEFMEDVLRTDDVLKRLTGQVPTVVRPPKGDLNWPKLNQLWKHGKTVALWNVDPRDYQMETEDEMERWCQRYRPSRGDIVLMHDNHPHAVRAVQVMGKRGIFQRYAPATIDQWIKKPSRPPAELVRP